MQIAFVLKYEAICFEMSFLGVRNVIFDRMTSCSKLINRCLCLVGCGRWRGKRRSAGILPSNKDGVR